MDIETSSPERIVAKLYLEALRQMETAVAALELGDPEVKARSLDKAILVVGELRSALDLERGGEIAENLDALYDFVNRQLVAGSASGEASQIREARAVLATLSEAWQELAQRSEGAAP
jgi:flagellar protein FliS